jgi:hypothetical protein
LVSANFTSAVSIPAGRASKLGDRLDGSGLLLSSRRVLLLVDSEDVVVDLSVLLPLLRFGPATFGRLFILEEFFEVLLANC